MRIHVVTIGKTKNTGLRSAIEGYVESVGQLNPFSWTELKDQGSDPEREGKAILAHLEKLGRLDSGKQRIVLVDVLGKSYDSPKFADYIGRLRDNGCQDLCFVIAGAFGYSDSLRQSLKQADRFSLSELTFTHDIARLILSEQIYRALHILKGSKYHHE